MSVIINGTKHIQGFYYDGKYQSALTPTPVIDAGSSVASRENADARQWHDISMAAKRGGCTLEWNSTEKDDDGDEWDIWVAMTCDEYTS